MRPFFYIPFSEFVYRDIKCIINYLERKIKTNWADERQTSKKDESIVKSE